MWKERYFKLDTFENFSQPLNLGVNKFKQDVRGGTNDGLTCSYGADFKWDGKTYKYVRVVAKWG